MAGFTSIWMWIVGENGFIYTLPLEESFYIQAGVQTKGEKVGAEGLEPTTSRMWTVQTAKRENGVSNVILPEVELFKV